MEDAVPTLEEVLGKIILFHLFRSMYYFFSELAYAKTDHKTDHKFEKFCVF